MTRKKKERGGEVIGERESALLMLEAGGGRERAGLTCWGAVKRRGFLSEGGATAQLMLEFPVLPCLGTLFTTALLGRPL
ncbi:Hypothetical predicted protein [Podarcis lilfordi]|uniref:Uncharacterized protein n=1 Tax=Podarcis lilfordi TaxID=74358 RepID=A0AA35LCA3_9SAUR|nr:Hypothetical predicted protein [Podarcis lilfordi]